MSEDARAPSALARLFASFANAVIDVGLDSIQRWLRERLGERAEVAAMTAEGTLVHLDAVRIPIGGRGMLALSRATVRLGGFPDVRLHEFAGVLSFGDDVSAAVRFEAGADVPGAWIAGTVEITRASWTAKLGEPKTMNGFARLVVTSRELRVEEGVLDGTTVRARFSGSGVLEAARESPRPLLGSITRLLLEVERGRVGPFVDAVSALVGRPIALPKGVPLDAQLDGQGAWDQAAGGRVSARIGAKAIAGEVRGTVDPFGGSLDVTATLDIAPALVLRSLAVTGRGLPRDEDVIQLTASVTGALTRPEVKGRGTARELGFRLGRARFVPPIAVRDVAIELFVKDERIVARLAGAARGRPITIDVDAPIRALEGARATVTADRLDAAFLRDVATTLDRRVPIPEDAHASVDFIFAGGKIEGLFEVVLGDSRLELVPLAGARTARVRGRVHAKDLVAALRTAGRTAPDIDAVAEVDGVVEEGAVRGAVVLRALSAREVTVDPGATFAVDAVFGDAASGRWTAAVIRAPHLVLRRRSRLLAVEALDVTLRVDRGGVVWDRAEGRIGGGVVSSAGLAFAGGEILALLSVAGIAVESLATFDLDRYVFGLASGTITFRRSPAGELRALGDAWIDSARLPVLARATPVLERYGLAPLRQDASGPVRAKLDANDAGVIVRDLRVDVPGAQVRGDLELLVRDQERSVDARLRVELADSYLRSSKLLSLPTILADRVVVPLSVKGPAGEPSVKVDLGGTIGRFLRENRVSAFVASAFGDEAAPSRRSSAHLRAAEPAPALREDLVGRLAVDRERHAAAWARLARRRGSRGASGQRLLLSLAIVAIAGLAFALTREKDPARVGSTPSTPSTLPAELAPPPSFPAAVDDRSAVTSAPPPSAPAEDAAAPHLNVGKRWFEDHDPADGAASHRVRGEGPPPMRALRRDAGA